MSFEISSLVNAVVAVAGTGIFAWLGKVLADRQARAEKKLQAMIEEHRSCRDQIIVLTSRIVSLETANDTGFPSWKKTQEGTWIYCNSEFAKQVLVPIGLRPLDIYGKHDDEILLFSPMLPKIMRELHAEAALNGFACRSDIRFHDKARLMTVNNKAVCDLAGEVTFLGIGCPQNSIHAAA